MESEVHVVRAILRQNDFLFRRHLVLSRTVLDHMKDNGLITDVTRRKILMSPAHKQVPILLHALEHSGIHSLRKLMNVLKTTGHGWMVDNILDTDISYASQGRIQDDIGYRDRQEPAFTRPQAQITDLYSSRRGRYGPFRPDIRKSITAGIPPNKGGQNAGFSLGDLLKTRQQVDQPEMVPRGIINPRTLFTDPIASGPPVITGQSGPSFGHLPSLSGYNQHTVTYPHSKAEIPMTLYGLNQAFSEQDQKNQQALSVLRQEEIAIRQLAEQNARDQGNVRRKQAAVQDIAGRLRDIHSRAKEICEPSPHPNIGRYRLAQLNQIPWSIDA